MKGEVKPVPEGFHTAAPRLYVKGVADAVEFYKQAFGAQELGRVADPSGDTTSAEIKIGNSMVSLSAETPQWGNYSPRSLGGTTMIITLNVEDADAVWERAVSSGAKEVFALKDQPYGYRQGRLEDPFGHFWIISTRIG
jgi:PhnB protein